MKRRRYEKNHWDAVIINYKEVQLEQHGDSADDGCHEFLERTRSFLRDHHLSPDSTFLPCHAIDLQREGELRAHVDSVRFSGGMVAGVSLLSSAIMRLKPSLDGVTAQQQQQKQKQQKENNDEGNPDAPAAILEERRHVDLLLPPLSLYVLTGVSRYEYSHELLSTGSVFQNQHDGNQTQVIRDQRYSLIFRDAKES